VEPINPFDMPGFFLNRPSQGFCVAQGDWPPESLP
jgi:hydroxypyruvate isomerase